MRALLFCGLALAVAAAHLAAWEALVETMPSAFRLLRAAAPASVAIAASGPRVAWAHVVRARGPTLSEHPTAKGVGSSDLTPHLHRAADEHGVRSEDLTPSHRPSPHRAAEPWPVYATRPPPALRLIYTLRQTQPGGGELAGLAELAWSGPGPGFTLRLATSLEGRAPREWVSEGGFDRAGLAPRRLLQRDGDRVTRRVDLDRASASARWPGLASEWALASGGQDRWSWLAQLAAIAEAGPRRPAVVHLQVAGLRGELGRWTLHLSPGAALPPEAQDRVPAPWRAAPLLHVVREPEHPYDLRVEAWLSPAIHHFPIALRLATPPGRWSFGLWLDAVEAGPAAAP